MLLVGAYDKHRGASDAVLNQLTCAFSHRSFQSHHLSHLSCTPTFTGRSRVYGPYCTTPNVTHVSPYPGYIPYLTSPPTIPSIPIPSLPPSFPSFYILPLPQIPASIAFSFLPIFLSKDLNPVQSDWVARMAPSRLKAC